MCDPLHAEPVGPVDYPESDGEPMAETDLATGDPLLRPEEVRRAYARAERERKKAERERKKAERERKRAERERDEAAARAAAAEKELEELRRALRGDDR